MCDPGDACNSLLVCSDTNPIGKGGCPISRKSYKSNIAYLGQGEVKRLHDELLKFRLATYQYTAQGPQAPTRLGFIIEDVEPSVAADAPRDTVDLYGYTSMAVAAVQAQSKQIEALQREVELLKRQLAEKKRR